ncbi:MAG: hypothetical protein IPP69_00730 [Flavobacteriales bacterium]|nr:hypothetical protein [Flavobacteriales bacterium]
MTIQKYEDWMRPQVIELFNMEYGIPIDEFDKLFGDFYEHPFQREHCIRIVSVDGQKVAGFQSFFYWPVVVDGRLIRSYQSGNSLVHPDFRGQRLFARMLNYIHEPESGFNCELLIGFPVEASYNSFIRNGWKNPFNLQWFIKPLNPVRSLLSNPEQQLGKNWGARSTADFKCDQKITAVAQQAAFDDYRFKYEKGDFFRFQFEENGRTAFFELKAQRRKKVIRELIIGKFLSSHLDAAFITKAFNELIRAVRKSSNFTLISCAINPDSKELKMAMDELGFRQIDRKIYFIAKGPVADEIKDWSNWWIYRSDIDTW